MLRRYPLGRLRFMLLAIGGHTELACASELSRNSAWLNSPWVPLTWFFHTRFRRKQQAVVVVGLQQVAEVPVVLLFGQCPVVEIGFRRLLQSEAEPVRRVRCDGDGPLPFGYLSAQLLELLWAGFDVRFVAVQGVHPGVVDRIKPSRLFSPRLSGGAYHVINLV